MPLGYEFPLQSDEFHREGPKRLKAQKVVLLDGFNGDDVVLKIDPRAGRGPGRSKSFQHGDEGDRPNGQDQGALRPGTAAVGGLGGAGRRGCYFRARHVRHVAARGEAGRQHSLEEHYPALHDLDYMVAQAAIDQQLMKMPKVAVMDLKDALSERDATGRSGRRPPESLQGDPDGRRGDRARLKKRSSPRTCSSTTATASIRGMRSPSSSTSISRNERKICFKTIVNLGNVSLSLDSERPQIVRPRLRRSQRVVDLGELGQVGAGRNPPRGIEVARGELLANPGERQKFAKGVIDDLDWIFTGCRTLKPTHLVVFHGEGVGESDVWIRGWCRDSREDLREAEKQGEILQRRRTERTSPRA